MKCYNCGSDNSNESIVCAYCGANLYAMDEDSTVLLDGYLPYQMDNSEDSYAQEGYMEQAYTDQGYAEQGAVYQKNKNTLIIKLAVAIGSIILIGTLLIGGILIYNSVRTTEYTEKIQTADRYVAALDYENAIVIYLEALEINDKDPELYIKIAETYVSMGRRDLAVDYLNRGYKITNDHRINDLLTYYIRFDAIEATEVISEAATEEVDAKDLIDKTDLSQVTVNNNLFQLFLNNTYSDYTRDFGSAQTVAQTDTELKITYSNFYGNTVFSNADGRRFDAAAGVPMVDAKASYIEFTSMKGLFPNYSVGLSYQRLREIFGPDLILKEENGQYKVSVEYSGCLVEIETNESGDIVSESAWNRITPLNSEEQNQNDSSAGTVSGKIINAVNGAGIQAHLAIRQGANMKTGQILKELDTSAQGTYSVDLPEGKYTILATANGFMDEYFTVTVVRGMTMANQNLTMSSTLSVGEIRIVLEWGSTPNDLDSHLVGTSSAGSSVHVSYQNMTATVNGTTIATLDVDDTSGYGPETTTITDGSGGSYEFMVYDYTNLNNSSSTALANSGATVKVYIGGQQPQVFSVPAGTGTIWHVCKIENGTVTGINTIGN
ncbi:MAG: hypothetical protein IJ079_00695 [Lachnospiraceae bacterium]|nr:hypothetical protein [Lachnospiraceae bacterium]